MYIVVDIRFALSNKKPSKQDYEEVAEIIKRWVESMQGWKVSTYIIAEEDDDK